MSWGTNQNLGHPFRATMIRAALLSGSFDKAVFTQMPGRPVFSEVQPAGGCAEISHGSHSVSRREQRRQEVRMAAENAAKAAKAAKSSEALNTARTRRADEKTSSFA